MRPSFFEKDSFDGAGLSLKSVSFEEPNYSQIAVPVEHTPVPMVKFRYRVSDVNYPRIPSWSEIVQPDLRYNPKVLVGDFLKSHSYQVKDVNLLWPHATVNFVSGDLLPQRTYAVHFETPETQKLSQELGKVVWLEKTFQSHQNNKFDWTTLYLKEFRCVTSDGQLVSDLKIKPETEILRVGFSITAETNESIIHQELFSIAESIQFTIALPDTTNVADFLSFNPRLANAEGAFHGLGAYDTEKAIQVVSKFVASMKKVKNQIYARDIVRQGPESVKREMEKIGYYSDRYRINRFNQQKGQTAQYRFAGLDREISLLEFIVDILQQDVIPHELGPFGEMHGTWVHQAQFIAGYRDLESIERSYFKSFLTDYMSGEGVNWTLWNLLFDSHGPGVHGVKFWRDLISLDK